MDVASSVDDRKIEFIWILGFTANILENIYRDSTNKFSLEA